MSNALSKKWLMIIVSMVLVLASTPLFSACGGDDDDEEGEATGTTPDEVVEKEFRLGIMATVFGSPDEMDQSPFMATDEINEAGGVKVGNTIYKFKMYWADDKGTANGGVAGIMKLLNEDKIDWFCPGGIFAGPGVIMPYLTEKPKIAVLWDDPDLTIGPDYPYVFRTQYDMRLNNPIVLDWVRQNTDLKKIEIVQLGMTRFQDMSTVEKLIWKEWGLDVHYTWYDWTTKDFYPVLTAALRNDPEAIVVTQSAGNSIIRQAKELGFEGQFILPEMLPAWWSDVLSAEDLEGLISMTPVDDNPEVPQAYKNYRDNYKKRYNNAIYSSKVFKSYMDPYLAAAVLKAAGSDDPDKMKEVMETQPITLEFPEGETMTIQFFGKEYYGVDHNWQPNQYLAVTEGGMVVQKETLSPLDQLKYAGLIEKYQNEAGEFVPEETVQPTETAAPRKLTADSTIAALLDNPETRAILEKHIPDTVSNPQLATFLTLRTLFTLAGDRIDQSKLPLIEADLKALYGE